MTRFESYRRASGQSSKQTPTDTEGGGSDGSPAARSMRRLRSKRGSCPDVGLSEGRGVKYQAKNPKSHRLDDDGVVANEGNIGVLASLLIHGKVLINPY